MASDKAKVLRRNPTEAEKRLWWRIRQKQVQGCRFRRQAPIGKYIVDFVCYAPRLVIEVDGGQHDTERYRDEARARWLEREGFRVLRFWNNEVLENTDGVVQEIEAALQTENTPHPNPPPQGGRE